VVASVDRDGPIGVVGSPRYIACIVLLCLLDFGTTDGELILYVRLADDPDVEMFARFGMRKTAHLEGTLLRREGDFVIDEGVVEAGAGGFDAGVGVVDGGGAGPVHGAEAHGAGFATGVDFAAFELEGTELLAGFADGHDFGVGGGVVGRGDAVGGGGDDLAVFDDDGAEWAARAGEDIVHREIDGHFHESELGGGEVCRHSRSSLPSGLVDFSGRTRCIEPLEQKQGHCEVAKLVK